VAPERIVARNLAWRKKEEEVWKRIRFCMNLDAPDQK
jgi:hypothetical protein